MAALRSRPLLLPLCSLIAGCAAAGSFGLYLPAACLPLLFVVTVLAIFLPANIFFLAALNLLIFFSGNVVMERMLTPDAASRSVVERHESEQLLLEGVIQSRPEIRTEGCRLQIRPDYVFAGKEELSLNGLVQLQIGSRVEGFASGDRIRFVSRLRAPRNFGIPGEFDAERYYALKRIVATSFVKNADSLVLMKTGSEYSLQRYFDKKAKNIGNFIMNCVPPVEGGILKALLIGDVSDISPELKDVYSRTGVNHILSISGFHVGIIAVALFQLGFVIFKLFPDLLLYLNFRRVVYAVSFPLILYYMFLSGAAPATARSVLMLGFVMFGLLLEREFDHINSLILAALVLLLLNPANLYDISFQLSFTALWGIMVLTPLFMDRFHALEQRRVHGILLLPAVSLAAITATMLPVAFYFHQSSLIGLVSNMFVVPILGYGAVITGFLAIPLIGLFPQGSELLLNAAGFLAKLSNFFIALLDKLPLLPVFVPTSADILISLVALLAITIAESNSFKYAVMFAVPLLLGTIHLFPYSPDKPVLRIDFFSVGQGESTLITFHDQKRMLIDGGGALHDDGRDIGKRLLVPALRTLGVKRIDYLVLSHPHPDHMQGVTAVAESFPVGEFWESGARGGAGYLRLKKVLAERKVPERRVNATTPQQELSGIRLRFLHPLPGSSGDYGENLNDESLVFRLEAGAFSALFAGDIGYQEEKRLSLAPHLLKSVLLKVPHHGSRYSVFPGFFHGVSPEIALIGAGYRNTFGLPSPEALKMLIDVGCKIYRTDHDGTITVKIYHNSKSPVISALKSHFN